jgi:Tfp pilus assembly protein PilW
MRQTTQVRNREAGFSLMELLVAMCVMMVITGAATSLLVGAFNVRSREDRRTDAIGDARRALNILSRELANSGYQLPAGLTYMSAAGSAFVPPNGLIPGDCDDESITFVANLNANLGAGDRDVNDDSEALKFQFFTNGNNNFLVRTELQPGGDSIVLANRIDGVEFQYLNDANVPVAVAAAVRVRITMLVTLNPVGTPGSTGYQAPSQETLSSIVDLRNATLSTY